MNEKREYGDYQTPSYFADKVCHYLKEYRHIRPSAVVEPTCGLGSFLKSSLCFDAEEYYGIEINPEYCQKCREYVSDSRVQIINSDFFGFSTRSLIKNSRQVLVTGNPPWITNSALSVLGSDNLPAKTNSRGLRGTDAFTGESNFDISENIILQLVKEYADTDTVISMLCKTSAARNIFCELKKSKVSFSSCDMLEFDAKEVFGISAKACVLVIQLSERPGTSDICSVYDFESPESVKTQYIYSDGRLSGRLNADKEDFDGHCCFEWRQGVKHDCADVMELTLENGRFINGRKETVLIEDDIVFPLVKSSMFRSPVIHEFTKFVIVTQKKVREETAHLKDEVPGTWQYLSDNITSFTSRKSSVYRGAPAFSMFGVGDYSYSRYKVGVSGFYKRPLFSVLYSDDGKPVMTDDTSYFICFDSYEMAYVAMLLLNSEKVQKFLTGIAFLDAKRPYTKKLLGRTDFGRIVRCLTADELYKTEQNLKLTPFVTVAMYDEFRELSEEKQKCSEQAQGAF